MAGSTRKNNSNAKLRGRLWVELAQTAALTEPGADLLEQIDALGSLSEAARKLGFSYRRAWMLIDTMNKTWPRPLVESQTGGTRGGGAHLTDAGHAVLSAYRDLQMQLEHLLDVATPAFQQALAPAGLIPQSDKRES